MSISVKIGEAGVIDVDVEALKANAAVSAYIFTYGLKQMLNDVHAGETAKKTPVDATRKANKRALVEKKLASLMAGEVAQERVGTTGSPVEREMFRMAEADLKTKLPAIGKKVGDFAKDVWAAVVAKQMAKGEAAYRAAAEAKLAIKADAGDFDIMSLLDDEPAEEEGTTSLGRALADEPELDANNLPTE